MRNVTLAAAAVAAAALLPAPAGADDAFESSVRHTFDLAAARLAATDARLPRDAYPQVTDAAGARQTTGASDWTSGVFPGSLWLEYAQTGNPAWRARAEAREAGLAAEARDTAMSEHG